MQRATNPKLYDQETHLHDQGVKLHDQGVKHAPKTVPREKWKLYDQGFNFHNQENGFP